MKVVTCEQVSDGHPDKLADQISDAIVTDCLKHDKSSRVAVETLIKDDFVIIAGEITSKWACDLNEMVHKVLSRVGPEKLDYGNVRIINMIRRQSADIALGVKKGGAGDQGIVYGYATNETPELLPIPYVLATEFLKRLKDLNHPLLKADAKSMVSFDYDSGKVTTFLCSVQHKEDSGVKDFKEDITRLMKDTCSDAGFNTDFKKLLNPTGRFVLGGTFADCGVTGRKTVCDTYGGVGRIGGALSGKDPTKLDRSGAYIARKIAKDLVVLGYCDRCEVQIAYAIGIAEPVVTCVDMFGTDHTSMKTISEYVETYYDLTPRGIIDRLGLLNINYNLVSSYGHFTRRDVPWEVVG